MPSRGSSKAGNAVSGKPSRGPQNRSENRGQHAESHVQYRPVTIHADIQQKLLNIFRDSLDPSSDDKAVVQEVKGHLFDRDFTSAFGKQTYLQVYASRWSPSRALGYLQILIDLQDRLLDNARESNVSDLPDLKVVSIGGGAGAELVGLGGWLHTLCNGAGHRCKMHICFLDIAHWGDVIARLHQALITPPPISKYASAAVKENNVALLSRETLNIDFIQQNVLESRDKFAQHMENADLVTLMFTLNELYSTSVPQTQQMLASVTSSSKPGSHLLVVDSPGSYSTVSINGSEKKYPMQWLLDHALLTSPQRRGDNETAPKWEKLITDESRWFRIPQGLQYPIDLENMRYQIHLYRRLHDGNDAVQA